MIMIAAHTCKYSNVITANRLLAPQANEVYRVKKKADYILLQPLLEKID